jgi:hypothetical protein
MKKTGNQKGIKLRTRRRGTNLKIGQIKLEIKAQKNSIP